MEHGWAKVPNCECIFFLNRENGLFLSVFVDDIILAGKNKDIDPMWTVLMKQIDLREPTSFLDHAYLGVHSTGERNKQIYCRHLQKYVRIQDLSGDNRKITKFGES